MTVESWWGPLERAATLPGVTDVLVNAPDHVWVDRGTGLERLELDLVDVTHVRHIAVRLAAAGGRRLDDAAPVVDARLPDGSRLHAALPPIADGCTAISIRMVKRGALSMDDLVHSGMVAPDVRPVLAGLVASRASVLISGATGAGKTTLLATMLGLVPHHERLVVIEESGEVMPDHPHLVRLVERHANVEGAGHIGLERLVREALRMRPDRVVLGECRGAELKEVMAAFNTGHRGGMLTVHANSAGDVPSRLHALGSLASMTQQAVTLVAAAAFDVVVHVERTPRGRRVSELGLLETSGGELRVVPAVAVDDHGHVHHHAGWRRLLETVPLRVVAA